MRKVSESFNGLIYFAVESAQNNLNVIKELINIVWLKRDIRSQDHLPLLKAEESGLPYLIIFIFEPGVIKYGDTSPRHLQFQYHSIVDLNKTLAPYHKKVRVFHADALDVFHYLDERFEISNIYSYQESGIALTYERDKSVTFFCRQKKINWQQFQRDGIIRGIKNRKDWDKHWYTTMHQDIIKNVYSVKPDIQLENPYPIDENLLLQLQEYPTDFQPAGETNAWRYLKSFVAGRGNNYFRHISKPRESRKSCSRISPYISWGNLSIRQAYQFVAENSKKSAHQFAYNNFLTRLKWHCHFIQKFEVECSYEKKCINAGDELLTHEKNNTFIEAWEQGETGYPLVDACMKCLNKTGWINFRMRAMLVSFFCHHLYQDWRDGTQHLARVFLDYEPGIHYPQFQMQAGTTGVNTIRIYNPIKQSKEQDPDGIFIKLWLPQLAAMPAQFIHEPFKMTLMEQTFYGLIIGKDYPGPIVDIEQAGKQAREKIWSHRKHEMVKRENLRILSIHTNRSKNDIQPQRNH